MRPLIILVLLAALARPCAASETLADYFNCGLQAQTWTVTSNQPLFTADATRGNVRLKKPSGGTLGTFQSIQVNLAHHLVGNFDVSISFSNAKIARVNGTPGNQIQLNAGFGGVGFAVVRSDESVLGGNNAHVYSNPPNAVFGTTIVTGNSGTLRLVRTGMTVAGYYNGTLRYSASYNSSNATVSFSLQANGTTDAISADFDAFSVTADDIVGYTPTPGCPTVCVGALDLDFTSAGLPTTLYDYWDSDCASGSASVANGSLALIRPSGTSINCSNGVALSTAFDLCGDFDVAVDFDLWTFPTPISGRARYASFYAYERSGATRFAVERYLSNNQSCVPFSNAYKSWVNNPDPCVSTFLPASGTTGKFRISRNGTVWRTYFWDNIAGAWVLVRSATGGTGPSGVLVYTGGDSPEAQEVHFDNWNIQDNLPPASCVSSLDLDFAGNSVPQELVVTKDTSCGAGTTSVSGGELILSRPAGITSNCSNGAALAQEFDICGDFDIRVQYSLTNFPNPTSGRARYATLYAAERSTGTRLAIERFRSNNAGACIPNGNSYKTWLNSPDDCAASWSSTSDVAGMLRIVRSGVIWRAYYSDSGGGSWSLTKEAVGGTGPVTVIVYSGGNSAEAQEVHYDNLHLTLPTPVSPGSTVWDPHMVLSPDGATRFTATIRDSAGTPISGSSPLWLDFSSCSGLTPCSSAAATWPIVGPSAASDNEGVLEFRPQAGGCTSGSALLMSANGLMATVPVKSLDTNGGFIVSALDFVGGVCNDYNNDGVIDGRDWDTFAHYIGRNCITDAASYFTVDAFTQPGPDSLFLGATILVCARITNTALEPAVLDSVVFQTAGWGIANPWSEIHRQLSVPVGAHQSVTLCTPFTIPSDIPRHGCFRVHSYPRFPSTGLAATELSTNVLGVASPSSSATTAASNGRQINRDSKPTPCPKVACPSTVDNTISQTLNFFHSAAADNAVVQGCLPANVLAKLRQARPAGTRPFGQNQCFYPTGVCHFPCGNSGMGIAIDPDGTPPHTAQDELGNKRDCDSPKCNAYHELLHYGVTPSTVPPAFWEHDRFGSKPATECYVQFLTKCLLGQEGCTDQSGDCGAFSAIPCPSTCQASQALSRENDLQEVARTISTEGPEVLLILPRTETDTTLIPIGTTSGVQLQLYHRAFLPPGWSYTISDTGLITVPDTVEVTISHPVPVACADTGRVIVYAYTPEEENAGDAEASVYRIGSLGDVNLSGGLDLLDVQDMSDWLVGDAAEPINPDAMDANNDGQVDLADVTRLVAATYTGLPLTCGSSTTVEPYVVWFLQESDTTLVVLDIGRPLRGLDVTLSGIGNQSPVSSVSGDIEVITRTIDDTVRVVMCDLNGEEAISGSVAFKIAGTYAVLGGSVADMSYHSGSIVPFGPAAVEPGVPPTFGISAFPNPVRGRLNLQVSLPRRSMVQVNVFDIAGRLTATIFDGTLDEGPHTLVWNGHGAGGNKVAAGLYLVRLTTLDGSNEKKTMGVRRVVFIP